jgi:alpha-L-fucosidase
LDAAGARVNHHLYARDTHYRDTRSYVEDVPVPEYRWASDAAYERFRNIKYGVRLHWGLYSILGQPNESWSFLQMSFAHRQRYQEMYKTWNPRGFNADEWMDLFAACSMKMFAFTTKHHKGFSMFDTRTRVRRRANWTAPGGPKIEDCNLAYSIMETPFRRDVVKELCGAAHKRDIKINLYFSHPDCYDAVFRPNVAHTLQAPSSDVLTKDCQGTKKRLGTVLHLRKLRPEVMFRARGIDNYGDYYTPEGFVPGEKSNTDTPWFVIYPFGRSFSYEAVVTNYKGALGQCGNWSIR